VIGADIDTLLLARKNFTPSFKRAPALTVEKVFGALRLGTEKGHLQKRTVPTAAAARADEFNPIFELSDRAFEPGPIDFLKEPSDWFIKRGFGRECESVKETHDSMSESLSRLALFTRQNICIQACPSILLKKIKTILLGKREFVNPFLPAGKEFL
jgi:hypothetical protein